jgi:ribosome-associated protein
LFHRGQPDPQTRCLKISLCYNHCKQAGDIILEAIEKARRIVEISSDKLASDIALLDTHAVCSIADYFVIVSGESVRQLAALSNDIERSLKKEGVNPVQREGTAVSGWMILDYGDVIVHVFSSSERGYYKLDELWSTAKPVVRIA